MTRNFLNIFINPCCKIELLTDYCVFVHKSIGCWQGCLEKNVAFFRSPSKGLQHLLCLWVSKEKKILRLYSQYFLSYAIFFSNSQIFISVQTRLKIWCLKICGSQIDFYIQVKQVIFPEKSNVFENITGFFWSKHGLIACEKCYL